MRHVFYWCAQSFAIALPAFIVCGALWGVTKIEQYSEWKAAHYTEVASFAKDNCEIRTEKELTIWCKSEEQ